MVLFGGVVCKKCKKLIPLGNYDPKKDVFIKCCGKKKVINTNEVIKIQHNNLKCPDCNKKVECFYIEKTCPHCGEKNIEEHCWKKPKGKPKFKGFNKKWY